jgi:hypothetical protein
VCQSINRDVPGILTELVQDVGDAQRMDSTR